jgi:hypothetical protein
MAFEYDRRTTSAFDSEKNIRIGWSTKFYDITEESFFVYRGPDLEFEFSAIQRREKRNTMVKGQLKEKLLPVATCILEPSLWAGLAKASQGKLPERKVCEAVKNDILAGMFVLETRGGQLLSFVSDYRVKFSQSPADIG